MNVAMGIETMGPCGMQAPIAVCWEKRTGSLISFPWKAIMLSENQSFTKKLGGNMYVSLEGLSNSLLSTSTFNQNVLQIN